MRQAPGDAKVQSIIDAMIHLSHALGIDVTAEGVETRSQLSLLMQANCDRAQGYLFSRPIPHEALMNYIAAQAPPEEETISLAA